MGKRKYTTLPYTEYTVAYGHFDTSRVYPIDKIVLHSSASTKQGLIDTFDGGTRLVSAHYGIDNDGRIMAFLEEYNVAYQAGNYRVNQSSIGIEHVDEGATVKKHTNEQYDTSIKLVADICKYYGIPCDIEHVVPHSAIVPTACPNGLDISRIIDGARILLTPPVVTPPVVTPPVEVPPVVVTPPVTVPEPPTSPSTPPVPVDVPPVTTYPPDVIITTTPNMPTPKPNIFQRILVWLKWLGK
jgi:hypothetical protein